MFAILLPVLTIPIVAALAVPVLLETINPTLVAGSVDIGVSSLNMTALRAADASARALSLAGAQSVHSSNISVLSPPRHASTIKIRLIPSHFLISVAETSP